MKLSKFFINLLAAGTVSMLCCAGAAAEPINSLDAAAGEVSGSAVDEKVKEVDGRKYAEKRSKIYFETFKKAYDCIMADLPTAKDVPERVGHFVVLDKCKTQVKLFTMARINLEGGPQLKFLNDAEKKLIIEDATRIDRFHSKVVPLFNMVMQLTDRNTQTLKMIGSIQNVHWWYVDNGEQYRSRLKEIDKLFNEYYNLKEKCTITSEYADCSARVLKQMEGILKKFQAYFSWNVKGYSFRAISRGTFLYDLDRHTRCFIPHLQDFLNEFKRLSGEVKKIRDNYKANGEHEALYAFSVKSPFMHDIVKTSNFPLAIEKMATTLQETFDSLYTYTENLPNTELGKFLTQADLPDYTSMAKDTSSGKYSYIRSVKIALFKVLLNTKDKNGRPLVHNVDFKAPLL